MGPAPRRSYLDPETLSLGLIGGVVHRWGESCPRAAARSVAPALELVEGTGEDGSLLENPRTPPSRVLGLPPPRPAAPAAVATALSGEASEAEAHPSWCGTERAGQPSWWA